jgi:hypothetical protein
MVKRLEAPQAQPEPIRTCDLVGCNVSRISSQMINFTMFIGSPGHPMEGAFQCGEGEHWGCSIDHVVQIGHACLDEHVQQELVDRHVANEESVHHAEASKLKENQGSPN